MAHQNKRPERTIWQHSEANDSFILFLSSYGNSYYYLCFLYFHFWRVSIKNSKTSSSMRSSKNNLYSFSLKRISTSYSRKTHFPSIRAMLKSAVTPCCNMNPVSWPSILVGCGQVKSVSNEMTKIQPAIHIQHGQFGQQRVRKQKSITLDEQLRCSLFG